MIWKRLLRKDSNQDRGTLLQLKNLINRTNVPYEPKADMNACENFLELILTSHILVAATNLLGMNSLEDIPSTPLLPHDIKCLSQSRKRNVLTTLSQAIVEKYTNLEILCDKMQVASKRSDDASAFDGVYEYAKETLTLTLLYNEFHDSIREGDGPRDIRCWKFYYWLSKPLREETMPSKHSHS